MNDKEQAARQALEALGRIHFAATELDRRNRVRWFDDAVNEAKEAITALREALAEQAEQEPVAFQMICPRCKVDRVTTPCPNRGKPGDCPMIATAQNAATNPVHTVDLTDDEVAKAIAPFQHEFIATGRTTMNFARAVIAADRRKNK